MAGPIAPRKIQERGDHKRAVSPDHPLQDTNPHMPERFSDGLYCVRGSSMRTNACMLKATHRTMDITMPGLSDVPLQRTWRRHLFGWRALAALCVFASALFAFRMGADVSARAGIPNAALIEQIYYSLGLFVLGGLDLGVPVGGPQWAQNTLWFSYFAAPAITTTALVEGVVRAVNPQMWTTRGLKGHTVVVGCGRLSILYMEALRRHHPKHVIVVVEIKGEHPSLEHAREHLGVRVMVGDILHEETLDRIRMEKARRLMILTGNDFVNLDAASMIAQRSEHAAQRTVIHLSDTRMAHAMKSHRALTTVTKFNQHSIAATHLVKSRLMAHFIKTRPRDVVVLAGFGRFGQTLLRELQHHASGRIDHLVIVDLNASKHARIFEEESPFDGSYRKELVNGDLRDPLVWESIVERVDQGDDEPVFILGSGDDSTNIRTAIWLSERFPRAYVVARCFRHSVFAEHAAASCNFHLVTMSDLLQHTMPDDWVTSKHKQGQA